MCGILGYLGEVNDDVFLGCLTTLNHRGPDGYGVQKKEGVTLGHRRLSILDLSEKGAQPMSYLKERYWITFNGEIYNFIELRKELISLGYSFESNSDTEVILAAFVEWKESCLSKFNGMWALAIWDTEDKVLFLSRDRFGVKPLFYATQENLRGGQDHFAFASEMKALAPLLKTITPDRELVLDLEKIFYYESTDRCLLKEIRRFPAGHYAWVKEGDIKLHRFWNTLDHINKVELSYEEQVKEFYRLFTDSCAIRMRSDVTIGTALSGGLDSSAVFSTVALLEKENTTERAGTDWQHAFCASFPNSSIDEKKYAQKVADHLHVPLDIVLIDPSKEIDLLYEHLYLFEDIYITSPIPFIMLYAEMRKQGVKVTLDGHGADEFLGGYPFDFLHIIHDELYAPTSVREVLATYYNTQDGNAHFARQSKFLFVAKVLVKNFVKKLIGYSNTSRESAHPMWKKLDYFTQKLYISSHETVLPTLLRNYDRYSMINGVEIRMPFMDYRLVTFMLSLPWQSKIKNGYTKSIVRDAMESLMPHDIAYRKSKIGWNSATTDWMKGPLQKFFLDTVESKVFKECDLVNAEELTKRLHAIIENPTATFSDGELWWRDMSPFFWEQGFLKRVRESAETISKKEYVS